MMCSSRTTHLTFVQSAQQAHQTRTQYHSFHFGAEEPEAQRGKATYPRSTSSKDTKPKPKLRTPDSEPLSSHTHLALEQRETNVLIQA